MLATRKAGGKRDAAGGRRLMVEAVTTQARSNSLPIDAEMIRAKARADIAASTSAAPLPDDLVIGESFKDFEKRSLPRYERIFGCAIRGQVVMINAITNGMKSTNLKLAGLCAVTGRAFPPFVEAGRKLVVMIVDFEGIPIQEREDIQRMMRSLSEEERELVRKNLYVAYGTEIEIDGEPLSMSNPVHFEAIKLTAMQRGVDVLIIDPLGTAFALQNESDNAEAKEKVMKPVKRLSVDAKLVTAMTHHIGKAKSEEGAVRVEVHRPRGASSFSDLSSSVFNLDYDRDKETVLISAAKIKGKYPDDVVLKLDPETRWLAPLEAAIPIRSNYRAVVELFAGDVQLKRADVVKALAGRVSDKTVDRMLKEAKTLGDIYSPKNGYYQAARDLTVSEGNLDI